MLTVFIGHDRAQSNNTDICIKSITKHTSRPVDIRLVHIQAVKAAGYNRAVEDGSTEFTYTRYIIPHLMHYKGIAVFCDSDFVWRDDIHKILKHIDPTAAVSVVKHDFSHVNSDTKMANQRSEWYPRKWWSSLMVFNCAHEDCRILTPMVVSTAPAKFLHRFEWTDYVGSLPTEFNYLVGYHTKNDISNPIAVHYTDGTPLFNKYRNCEYAEDYIQYE